MFVELVTNGLSCLKYWNETDFQKIPDRCWYIYQQMREKHL